MLESVDPWGQLREDLRFGKLAADVANMLGMTKNGRAMVATDYVLDLQGVFTDIASAPPSIKVLENQFLLYARMHNAALAQREAQRQSLRKLGN